MKEKFAMMLLVIAVGSASLAFAQTGGGMPVADGTVGQSEYANVHQDNRMTVYSTITSNTLYIAVTAPTDGWVAVGLGTSKMNGATIFMGYVDDNMAPQTTVQRGSGHSHSATQEVTPISEVVGSGNGITTLEIAVNRADFADAGQKQLDYIYAYGTAKNFRTRHVFRNAGTLSLQ
ncbi:MAG TPA: DOMON domain-containing protein [Spirochaetia bacterium]|nr:DOMON domain-containing protein [Spirochaetia bacterium]